MIINVTYDASAASAPAGFARAVQAAVQYWESAISNNITINIDFGWGEVGGQTIDPGALGESSSSLIVTTAQAASTSLPTWGSKEPGAIAAYQSMYASTAAEAQALTNASATINPNTGLGGGVFTLTLAEARALGYFSAYSNPATAIDGYVGLDSSTGFTFDPNNRTVSGEYDAIGVLEHEISEVLGRSNGLGAPLSNGTPTYAMLDLYRYTAIDQPTLSPGDASFSFDGGRNLLLPFNNPGNGGDAGDWDSSVGNDSFGAFANPGAVLTTSSVDLRVMEALGYSLNTPQDVIGSSNFVTGVSANGTVTNSGGNLTLPIHDGGGFVLGSRPAALAA